MTRSLAILAVVFLLTSQVFAQPLKLALNWKAEPQFGGFYAAQDFFRKENLQVQILEGGSGTPTLQMLLSGQVDFAVVSADEIVIAQARGAKDIVAIFATFQTNPQGIMTHAQRGFQKLEDVFKQDGTLLWQAGLPYALFLKKKVGSFKVRTAPYLGGIGPFQKDPQISQQCFITAEPLTARAAGLEVKTFLVADAGYNPYTTVLAVRASDLKKNAEQVRKVVAAVRQGWSSYLKSPSATNKAMKSLNKAMSLETFQKSAEAQKPLIEVSGIALGSMTTERWQTLADQLLDLGLIKNKILAGDLFTNL